VKKIIHKTDVAIIGSGVSGAMIAHELSKSGVKVLMLEAGPRVSRESIFKKFTSEYIGQNLSAPYPNTKLAPRPDPIQQDNPYHLQTGSVPFNNGYLRLVGGTTWHWGAVAMRFLTNDFQTQSVFDKGENWPITYKDLEAYYAKAEKEMSVSGPRSNLWNPTGADVPPLPPQAKSYLDQYIQTQAREIEMEFSQVPVARNSIASDGRPACHGHGSCSPICPIGAQYAAISHVEKAEKAGAKLIDNALVTSINVDEESAVSDLSVQRPDGSTELVQARIYVIAANAIETPRLMLLSASERLTNGLGNSSDQVGRNLMSHPGFNARMTIKEPVYSGRGPRTGLAFQTPRDGQHRAKHAPYYLEIINAVNVAAHAQTLLESGEMGAALNQKLRDLVSRDFTIFARSEQLPSASNRITLSKTEKDTAGLAKISFNYHIDDYTKNGLEDARQNVDRLAKHLGAAGVDYYAEEISPHPMGTARMGADPKNSVVDSECRTHDHNNLFITGGAVFSSGGTAPPTLTIAALSLRAADTIRKQLS
jgi:choline dehydrogenase-like flavoprotein